MLQTIEETLKRIFFMRVLYQLDVGTLFSSKRSLFAIFPVQVEQKCSAGYLYPVHYVKCVFYCTYYEFVVYNQLRQNTCMGARNLF